MIGSKLITYFRMAINYFWTNLRVRHLFFVRHLFVRLATLLSHISKNFRKEGRTKQTTKDGPRVDTQVQKEQLCKALFFVCVFVGLVRWRVYVEVNVEFKKMKDIRVEGKWHGSELIISSKLEFWNIELVF